MIHQVIVAPLAINASLDSVVLAPNFHIAEAEPDDHDSAIGTVGSIDDAETDMPTVNITPYDPAEVTGWLMYSVKVGGLNGKRTTINTPMGDTRYLDAVPDPVHRADSNTWVSGRPPAWLEFDNTVGTNPILSSMNTDFTGDMEFAMKPRWKYADTVSAVAYATASPYAQTLPSVTANAGAANSFNAITITSTVPNSAPLTTLQQHAFCLDDTANQPDGGEDKLNFVILARQHSSEDQGSYAAWEFIKYYLDGVGTDADWFRKHSRVYFYDPNPAGVYYGAERHSVSDAGGEDTNRQWAVGDTSSPVVVATKAAIQLDVADVDGFFDFHGFFSLYPGSTAISADWAGFDTIGGPSNANEIAFRARVSAAAAHTLTYGNGPEGENNLLAQHWGKNTLGAQLSQTIELGPEMPGYPDPNSMYGGIVQTMVQAFTAMVANDELVLRGTLTDVGTDLGTPYTVLENTGFDLATPSAILELVGMDAQTLYNVAALVRLDNSSPYNIRENIGSDLGTPYAIAENVGAELQTLFNILESGVVGINLQTPYVIRELIGADLDTPSNILTLVAKDVSTLYNVLEAANTVGISLSTPYSVQELAGLDLATRYNILGDLVARELKRDGGTRLVRLLHENKLIELKHKNVTVPVDLTLH